MERLAQDVRFAARSLLKSPGFAVATVVTLALGIGANTAIFSLINGVLLKPLPYRDGERLVLLTQSAPQADVENLAFSIQEVYDYRDLNQTLSGLVEHHSMQFTLLGRSEPERVSTGVVSAPKQTYLFQRQMDERIIVVCGEGGPVRSGGGGIERPHLGEALHRHEITSDHPVAQQE